MLFALKSWFGTSAPKAPKTHLNVESLEGREVPAVGAFVKACPSDPVLQRLPPARLVRIPGVQIANVVRVNPFVLVGPQPEPPTRGTPGEFVGILLPSL
jgi:hypothetical protein